MHSIEGTATLAKSLIPSQFIPISRAIYESFLNFISFGKGVLRIINGEEKIYVSPHFRFIEEEYEPTVYNWLKSNLKHGDVFVDVGAQFGIYSILAANWVGTSGKVFAFEPSPVAYEAMQQHLRLNAVEKQVDTIAVAVGENCGKQIMYYSGADPQNTLAAEVYPHHQQIEVSVVPLDYFFAQKQINPTLVKIDTEGWELHVLRGATKLLEQIDSTKFVVEMHPYAWNSAGYSREDFEEFLANRNIAIIPLQGQKDPFSDYGNVILKSGSK